MRSLAPNSLCILVYRTEGLLSSPSSNRLNEAQQVIVLHTPRTNNVLYSIRATVYRFASGVTAVIFKRSMKR
jgi:hypothetical protein